MDAVGCPEENHLANSDAVRCPRNHLANSDAVRCPQTHLAINDAIRCLKIRLARTHLGASHLGMGYLGTIQGVISSLIQIFRFVVIYQSRRLHRLLLPSGSSLQQTPVPGMFGRVLTEVLPWVQSQLPRMRHQLLRSRLVAGQQIRVQRDPGV